MEYREIPRVPDEGTRKSVSLAGTRKELSGYAKLKFQLKRYVREVLLGRQRLASHSYRYFSKMIAAEHQATDRGMALALSSTGVREKDVSNTALFLAYSLNHELDSRVLILDTTFDVDEDSLTRRFGADQNDGYLQLVSRDGLVFHDLVLPTAVDGVFFLPSGAGKGAKTLNLKPALLDLLLQGLAQKFDYLLFLQGDLMTDTRYMALAEKVDLNLFLAEENRTLLRELKDRESLYLDNGIDKVRYIILPP